jgi:hypothetical protein
MEHNDIDEICPTMCECKTVKGRKLYDIYCSWVDEEGITPFSELSHKEKVAWIMSANWKRKPDEPPEDKMLEEDVETIKQEIENIEKEKKDKKKRIVVKNTDNNEQRNKKKLETIKKKKEKDNILQLGA